MGLIAGGREEGKEFNLMRGRLCCVWDTKRAVRRF